MNTILRYYILTLSLLVANTWLTKAQQTIWSAELAPVTESGYYNIALAQPLISGTQNDYADMRIYNTSGTKTETPFFIRAITPTTEETKLIDYPIQSITKEKGLNRFKIENNTLQNIKDLYVTVNRTELNISAIVRASHDNKTWFNIKPKSPVNYYDAKDRTQATLFIQFALGNYKYYEIELFNDNKETLDILKVNTVISTQVYGQFEEVNLGKFKTTTDQKNRNTVITFPQQRTPLILSKLIFSIDTKMEYHRNATLIDSIKNVSKSFTLTSNQEKTLILNSFPSYNAAIVISNADNPPLQITEIKGFAIKRYACAYLEAGTTYSLSVGDPTLKKPNYDIIYFKDKIQDDLPTIETLNITKASLSHTVSKANNTDKPKSNKEETKQDKESLQNILWIVLIVIGLFIAILCYKSFQKMEKNQ